MNHPTDDNGQPWPVNRKPKGHHPVIWIVRICAALCGFLAAVVLAQ